MNNRHIDSCSILDNPLDIDNIVSKFMDNYTELPNLLADGILNLNEKDQRKKIILILTKLWSGFLDRNDKDYIDFTIKFLKILIDKDKNKFIQNHLINRIISLICIKAICLNINRIYANYVIQKIIQNMNDNQLKFYIKNLLLNEEIDKSSLNLNLNCETNNQENLYDLNLQKELYSDDKPSCWKNSDSKLVTLLNDNLTVKYTSNEKKYVLIKSNKPILKNVGIFYFEIYLVRLQFDTIGIGLVCNDYSTLEKLPGWSHESIGYHSDDGNIFISKNIGEKYGPSYNSGDVIGCCVNNITSELFFTKNGIALVNFYNP